MNYSKIASSEAIALIVVIALNQIVLNLPKGLLDSCGSSTPLNIIYVTIISFIFLYFVIKLFKNFSNYDILDISEFLGGKFLKTAIGILFIIYFTIFSGTLLRDFSEILKVVYFPKTPIYIILILFLSVTIIGNKLGPNTIVKTNLIILPIVMINLLIAYFAVFSRFIPERVFPILGYGVSNTFFSGATNIFAFSGLAYIYFILPMLKKKEHFKRISFIALGISSLYIFFSVTFLLFSFSDILNENEISPIYLLIRGTYWGRFIQRPDAIFFFGWILCLMSYLSINLMFICKIFKKIGNLKANSPLIYAASALIFIIALIPSNTIEIRFIENTIFKYATISLIYILCLLLLVFANMKYKKFHKTNNEESGLENAQ